MPDLSHSARRFLWTQLGPEGSGWEWSLLGSGPTSPFGEPGDPDATEWRLALAPRTPPSTTDLERARQLARDDAWFRSPAPTSLVTDASGAVLRWTNHAAAVQLGPERSDPASLEVTWATLVPHATHIVFRGVSPARKLVPHLVDLTWGRVLDGLEVAGDDVRARVNVSTGRLVSYQRGRFAKLPELGDAISPEDALKRARAWAQQVLPGSVHREGPHRSIRWNPDRQSYVRVRAYWFERERAATGAEVAAAAAPSAVELYETSEAVDAEPDGNTAGRAWDTGVVHIADDGAVLLESTA